MKKLIMAAGLAAGFATGLAALMAAPALAQSYNPTYGSGNTVPTPYAWGAAGDVTGSVGALAYSPAHKTTQTLRGVRAQAGPSPISAGVSIDGRDVGTDPDANIRFQLLRDPPGRD